MAKTRIQQDQQQYQPTIKPYFEKDHNDGDSDNHNDNDKGKYQYNSHNSCQSNKNIFNIRYENLRTKAMKMGMRMEPEEKNTNTPPPSTQELSIFIQRGMIDWVEAWNKCRLNKMIEDNDDDQKIKETVFNDKDRQLNTNTNRNTDTDTETETDTDTVYSGINLPLILQPQLENLLVNIVLSTLSNKKNKEVIT